MTLKELKNEVDILMERGCEDYEVLINLAEPSWGPSAMSPIKTIYAGFDWEEQQIRIAPMYKLYSASFLKANHEPRIL